LKRSYALFTLNPFRRLKVALIHDGSGPIFDHVSERDDGNELARAHDEQPMRVIGTIQIEVENPVSINRHDSRDHSWEPRCWQSIASYRWISENYRNDLDRRREKKGVGVLDLEEIVR